MRPLTTTGALNVSVTTVEATVGVIVTAAA
jgi:hypothetical protein